MKKVVFFAKVVLSLFVSLVIIRLAETALAGIEVSVFEKWIMDIGFLVSGFTFVFYGSNFIKVITGKSYGELRP